MKDRIAKWYKMGLWSAAMVRNAAQKGVLRETEAAQILNQEENHA